MAFPTSPLDVRVELALGVDLTASPSVWLWTDATQWIYVRDRIRITRGRPDESSTADTSTCAMTADNRSGRWSTRNPVGAWYGQLRKGTPLRVQIRRILDGFGRDETDGWGSADSGQAWTCVGGSAADFSVGSGVGSLSLGSVDVARSARAACALAYGEIYAEFTLPAVATGGAIDCFIVDRSTDADNEYRFRVSAGLSGALAVRILCVVAGVTSFVTGSVALTDTYVAGGTVAVRAQMAGPTLRMKAWSTSGDEPAGYHAEGTDTTWARGAAGAGASLAAANTNALPVVVDVDNFEMRIPRFSGFLASLPPRWDLSGNDRHSPLDAKGLLYRLSQGTSPQRSALKRTILGANASVAPIAYWPLEDGEGAPFAASGLVSGRTARVDDTVVMGTVHAGAGSMPLPDLTGGGRIRGEVPAATAGAWAVSFVTVLDEGGDGAVPIRWTMRSGEVAAWYVLCLAPFSPGDPSIVQLVWNSGTGATATSAIVEVDALYDGRPHLISATGTADGTDTDVELVVDAVSNTDTVALTTGTLRDWAANPDSETTEGLAAVGHVAIYDTDSPPDVLSAVDGYIGEQAHVRFLRLCAEETIEARCGASGSLAMGPQPVEAVVPLLRECETADQGLMYEGLHHDLVLQGHQERENMPVALALTYTTPGHVGEPFEPTDDDAGVVNDVEVRTTSGTSAREVDEDPDSELSIPNIGRRDESVEANLYVEASAV